MKLLAALFAIVLSANVLAASCQEACEELLAEKLLAELMEEYTEKLLAANTKEEYHIAVFYFNTMDCIVKSRGQAHVVTCN